MLLMEGSKGKTNKIKQVNDYKKVTLNTLIILLTRARARAK